MHRIITHSLWYLFPEQCSSRTVRLNAGRNASDVTMRYLLRTNTSYEHLAKKFERTVLTCVGRDGSEMAVCLRRVFVR